MTQYDNSDIICVATTTDHFSIAKSAVGVLLQGDDDRVEDLLHPRNLDVLLASNEILINSLEPPWVVVAVGDDVHIDGIVTPVWNVRGHLGD